MKANTKLTVNHKIFYPGDTITEKLNPADERFLLREGYIEKGEAQMKNQTKKAAATTEPEKKE